MGSVTKPLECRLGSSSVNKKQPGGSFSGDQKWPVVSSAGLKTTTTPQNQFFTFNMANLIAWIPLTIT